MAALTYFLLSSLTFGYASANLIVYPLHDEQETLATMISCQVGESRSFRYSSVTNLWGSVEGRIGLNGEVTMYCLGNDDEGEYGDTALRYILEISNLMITESHSGGPPQRLVSLSSTRRKRGIGDFFSNTWKKIKNFFNRVFGRGGGEEEKVEEEKSFSGGRRETEDTDAKDETATPKPAEEEDEGPETMNYEVMYSLPFEFVQLADGSIPEVRFAQEETDGRVRNFKRHIVDSFATQLAKNPEMTKETSVIGEHLSNYSITVKSKNPETIQLAGIQSGALNHRGDENHILVEKFITEDDILNLAPNHQSESANFNDRDKLGLKSQQKQIFVRGKLVSSTGKSTVSLFDTAEKKRTKREITDEDVMTFFRADSEFELKVEKRKKRSVTEDKFRTLQAKSTKFKAASRFAETEDSSEKQKLRNLQKSVGNTTAFVVNLVDNPPEDEEKMQIVFEMVEEEVRLQLDEESHSMAGAIRKILTAPKMLLMCRQDRNRCRDYLQLVALAGKSEAEQVLLACFSDQRLDLLTRQQVADILSDVSHPSEKFLSALIARLEVSTLEPELRGVLCLSTASIASQSEDPHLKSKTAEVLIAMLETERSGGCSSGSLILDILEAMGNLGHVNTMKHILKASAECSHQKEIQIACAHALRHLSSMPEVQEWMLNAIKSQSCDVTRAVIGSLTDKIASQENARDMKNWPRNGFNNIDQVFKNKLMSSSSEDDFQCALKDAVRYFRKKKCKEAKEIVDMVYSEDAEPWSPGTGSRHKRDLRDKLKCKDWTEDTVYRPIQDKEEFETDKLKYNRRKSCLASKKFGIRGANAEIYTGMFAGVNDKSDPPQYKLFTKFVSGLNFLGHEMEIGSFYFYHRSGNTKAYVRIMGRTRQELSHEGCTPTELRYRPITHIPLFLVTVSSVQLSLGIHLSCQLSVDTQCPETEAEAEKYILQPVANVRVGGEAMGTVLFIRGAFNLGGNFHYGMKWIVTPSPNMCLEGYHGYEPMTIGFEAYFQLWNVVKRDWGKQRIWRPDSMTWQIRDGRQKPLFNQTCVLDLPAENSDGNGESKVSDENSLENLDIN